MGEIHIPSLAPEIIGHLGPLALTNTMVNTWLAILILFIIGVVITRTVQLRPTKLQNAFEFFIESLLSYFDQVTGNREKSRQFFPLVGSVFFFILLSNWLGLIPGTGSLLAGDSPLLRPANTDLNLTLAMALVSVLASHVIGFISIGFFAHANKFIQVGTLIKSLRKGPVAIFTAIVEILVGIIEMIGEVAKVISLSLRLFGNIFAGEVLISVIGALMSVFAPVPFMLLEVLVGLIQAVVFTMLSLVYLTLMSEMAHSEES